MGNCRVVKKLNHDQRKGNSLASDQLHVHCAAAVESGDRDRTFTVKNIVTVHSSCSDQSEINQTGDE